MKITKRFDASADFCRRPEPILWVDDDRGIGGCAYAYDTFNVRDGSGFIVEAWRAISVVSFPKRRKQSVLMEIDGYRDTSEL